jgi:hypothetical protein
MTKMKKIMLLLISFCVSLVFLFSCSGTQTTLEKNRGRAFESARYKQTVNPDPQSLEIIEGTHGLAGDAVMNSYHDSFKQQKREEIVNIIQIR